MQGMSNNMSPRLTSLCPDFPKSMWLTLTISAQDYRGPEPLPAGSGQSQRSSLERSPVHHRANTQRKQPQCPPESLLIRNRE